MTLFPAWLQVRIWPRSVTELTKEELQSNEAAHKVVKVNAEVRFTVAGHDDLMQGVVEREACPNAKRENKKQARLTLNSQRKAHVEEVSWMHAARTSVLHGHAHLRGTHTATPVHVPSFVQVLMERAHTLI